MKITYIHHSAFCIETDGIALVFDYFKGDCIPSCTYHGTLPELGENTPIYVFSSHSHRDHFDVEVLRWKERYPNIHYIFAKEIKKKLGNSMLRRLGIPESIKETITYVKPGECYEVGGLAVETLLSTDSGVAFLVTVPHRVSQDMDSHKSHSTAEGRGFRAFYNDLPCRGFELVEVGRGTGRFQCVPGKNLQRTNWPAFRQGSGRGLCGAGPKAGVGQVPGD